MDFTSDMAFVVDILSVGYLVVSELLLALMNILSKTITS